MRTQPTTQQDSASGLAEPVPSSMPWRVAEVHALANYQLEVRFVDGTTGVVDISDLILSPDAGVFTTLREKSIFERVYTKCGAVTWSGESYEIDLAPDAMYAEVKKSVQRPQQVTNAPGGPAPGGPGGGPGGGPDRK